MKGPGGVVHLRWSGFTVGSRLSREETLSEKRGSTSQNPSTGPGLWSVRTWWGTEWLTFCHTTVVWTEMHSTESSGVEGQRRGSRTEKTKCVHESGLGSVEREGPFQFTPE